ncbi:hypothetical protein nbrc107696_40600 [Gordonia spumicola]|uniref:Phospholipase A2 n=1 Tax=Gordonia spumicola TaxID=589161 RepID=A0A7I9VE76_9ACTN|nr:hypothetical protein [Gordonia spumicola]GEE03614.1 hypothetical protein nbrc107696_40600 [Gordonia spumicola]
MTEKLTVRIVVRRIVTAVAVSVFATVVLGSAAVASASSVAPPGVGPVTNPTERAVAALVGEHPEDALYTLPDDFVRVVGYRPVIEAGRPANPWGGCSSPIPLPDRFEPACRSHDFGYDLLRYGDRTGEPAAAWARRALDQMLVNAMHAVCTDPLCDMSAGLADGGLTVNSWRQGWSAPSSESAADVASTTVVRLTETMAGRR